MLWLTASFTTWKLSTDSGDNVPTLELIVYVSGISSLEKEVAPASKSTFSTWLAPVKTSVNASAGAFTILPVVISPMLPSSLTVTDSGELTT